MLATLPMLLALSPAAPIAPPAPGERVRYSVSDKANPTTATVVDAGPGWMVVRPHRGRDVRLATDGLTRLEVARGRRSRAAEGAGLGFLTGAAVGGVLGLTACLDAAPSDRFGFSPQNDYCSGGNAGLGLVTAGVFGAGGAALGALVGVSIKTDHWHRIPTHPVATSLSVAPVRGGAAMAVRVAWR
jgi:hypothetical protein